MPETGRLGMFYHTSKPAARFLVSFDGLAYLSIYFFSLGGWLSTAWHIFTFVSFLWVVASSSLHHPWRPRVGPRAFQFVLSLAMTGTAKQYQPYFDCPYGTKSLHSLLGRAESLFGRSLYFARSELRRMRAFGSTILAAM